jgi:aspartate 1-decarboxylase
MKKILYILLLLAGCSTQPAIYSLDNKLNIDPKLLQECEILPYKKINTIDQVLLENIDLYEKYAICARQQHDSISILKELN